MPRREIFYAPAQNFAGDFVTLVDDELHHLARVLHHKAGDRITVVDGAGVAAVDSEIVELTREFARVRILKKVRRYGEAHIHLALAQAVPKGSRFDWVIEKGTELGVSEFIPILCALGEVEAGENKVERWRRLALAAMKQSCRSFWPIIHAPITFEALCEQSREYQLSLIAHEGADEALRRLTEAALPRKAVIAIGPEGGFTEVELRRAQESNFYSMSLGPRRLRAETAGLVAVTKLLTTLGQMS